MFYKDITIAFFASMFQTWTHVSDKLGKIVKKKKNWYTQNNHSFP